MALTSLTSKIQLEAIVAQIFWTTDWPQWETYMKLWNVTLNPTATLTTKNDDHVQISNMFAQRPHLMYLHKMLCEEITEGSHRTLSPSLNSAYPWQDPQVSAETAGAFIVLALRREKSREENRNTAALTQLAKDLLQSEKEFYRALFGERGFEEEEDELLARFNTLRVDAGLDETELTKSMGEMRLD